MNKINNYFDKIFVINLESRLDKKVEISQKLNRLGIDYEFFNAINGYTEQNVKEFNDYFNKPINLDYSHELELKYNKKMIMSPGAWGLLKSYKNILLKAKEEKYKRILVFEDDVIFHNNFHNRFEEYINSIDENWKLLLLGATQHVWQFPNALSYSDKSKVEFDSSEPFYHPLATDGAFSLGIDDSVYSILLDEINKMNCAFDSGPMRTVFKHFHNKCFVAQPNLCIADVTTSNIGKKRNQFELSTKVKWDIAQYDYPFQKELISVLMPTFNAEKTIEKSIKSILNQTYNNIEIIVVDDTSTDNTVNIVRELSKNNIKIRLFENTKNKGCYCVRNDALRHSHGSIIAIQDPDDISLKDRLIKSIVPIVTNKAEFTIGRMYRSKCHIEELDIENENEMMSLVESRRKKNDRGFYNWLDRPILALATTVFKRELFNEFGLFWETRFSGDAEILERILLKRIGKLFTNKEYNVHSFLMDTKEIKGLYKRIDDVVLISPIMEESNLTNKYKGKLRSDFEDLWRKRLLEEYDYNYPEFTKYEQDNFIKYYEITYGYNPHINNNNKFDFISDENILIKQLISKNQLIKKLNNEILWYDNEINKVIDWHTSEENKIRTWYNNRINNIPNWIKNLFIK